MVHAQPDQHRRKNDHKADHKPQKGLAQHFPGLVQDISDKDRDAHDDPQRDHIRPQQQRASHTGTADQITGDGDLPVPEIIDKDIGRDPDQGHGILFGNVAAVKISEQQRYRKEHNDTGNAFFADQPGDLIKHEKGCNEKDHLDDPDAPI